MIAKVFRYLPWATCFVAVSGVQAAPRTTNLWWMPENISVHGEQIDHIFYIIFWMCLAVFVGTQIAMVWFLIKYRRKPGSRSIYSHGNNTLEIIWTATPLLIFLLLGAYSQKVWHEMRQGGIPDGALVVDIVAEQFGFHFRYPGPDGVFGQTDMALMNGGNPFGMVPDDPAGADDVKVYNEMVVPIGRPVQMILRSRDVIHSYYVPALRLYQDMVPGKSIDWVWFNTFKGANLQIACNQLCGSGHYRMFAALRVVPEEAFDNFLKERGAPATKTASEAGESLAAVPGTDSEDTLRQTNL
ncbi:MAG: cytochrome c oxidase subunit II [Candidatus Methylacidiphilales bacterium]